MAVITRTMSLETEGTMDIVDLTDKLRTLVGSADLNNGIVHVFAPGSTMGLTTVEFEGGLVQDLKDCFEKIVPSTVEYRHNERWGDGNAHSHVRSSMIGTSLTIPLSEGNLILGTWQQVILIDFDNRPRHRELVVQILGE